MNESDQITLLSHGTYMRTLVIHEFHYYITILNLYIHIKIDIISHHQFILSLLLEVLRAE